jgi:isoleucyl-tRNA synthetase
MLVPTKQGEPPPMSESLTFSTPFSALPARIDLPEMDTRIIAWWRENQVFRRSLERTQDGTPWVFYEGPPTGTATACRWSWR